MIQQIVVCALCEVADDAKNMKLIHGVYICNSCIKELKELK